RVGVHPPHIRFWKKMGDRRLNFFGPEACVNERVFTALGAFLGHGGGVSAKVATQSCHVSMKRERDTAVRAVPGLTAIATEQRGRKAAPIQKQNRLRTFFEPISNRVRQLFGKNGRDLGCLRWL